MNCEQYDDLLNDYVDGALSRRSPEAKAEEFERHLSTCARCQALVADFTTIRRTASALDEPVPPPRVWAKISTSLEQPRRPLISSWMPVALAASLALLVAGAAWLAWRQAPPREQQQMTAAAPEDSQGGRAEADYAQAIAGLERLVDQQNTALDADTRAVLQQNLAVVDKAISESRAALAAEPENTVAEDSLLDALDTKVALLQDTVALATEELNQ